MMEELIKDIRSDLRRAMNGIVSASMREKGVDYRMNFGVDILKLRTLATRYPHSAELAQKLWSTDARELKILATMLYPVNEFSRENAEAWARELPNQEIREQVCMNLFQKLDFSADLVQKWISSPDENLRTTGFWLFSRLVISCSSALPEIDLANVVSCAVEDLSHASVFVRQSALNALKYAGRADKNIAASILEKVSKFSQSSLPAEREIYDALSFEFEN